jgi:hypothetical protein
MESELRLLRVKDPVVYPTADCGLHNARDCGLHSRQGFNQHPHSPSGTSDLLRQNAGYSFLAFDNPLTVAEHTEI